MALGARKETSDILVLFEAQSKVWSWQVGALVEGSDWLLLEVRLSEPTAVELVTVANVLLASPHPGPYPRAVGPVLSSKGLDRAC